MQHTPEQKIIVLTEAEFDAKLDAKLLDAINKAFVMHGLARKEHDRKQAQRKVLTIDEVGTLTKKAKPTLYPLAKRGIIPNFKQGGRIYFYEDEVLAWLESGRRLTPAQIDAAADASLKPLHR